MADIYYPDKVMETIPFVPPSKWSGNAWLQRIVLGYFHIDYFDNIYIVSNTEPLILGLAVNTEVTQSLRLRKYPAVKTLPLCGIVVLLNEEEAAILE